MTYKVSSGTLNLYSLTHSQRIKLFFAGPSAQYNDGCKLHPIQAKGGYSGNGFGRQLTARLMLLIHCLVILV